MNALEACENIEKATQSSKKFAAEIAAIRAEINTPAPQGDAVEAFEWLVINYMKPADVNLVTTRNCNIVRRALQQQTVDVPEGWKLVPIKATDQMARALWASRNIGNGHYAYERAIEEVPIAPCTPLEKVESDDFDSKQRGMEMLFKQMGFSHKWEGGFHHIEGHGFSYKHIGLLNIGYRIKHYIETLRKAANTTN